MTAQRPRAIFFDVGGTLIQPYPSVGAVYASVAHRHGIDRTPDEMDRAFRRVWSEMKRPGLTVSRKEWWRELVFRVLGQDNARCFEDLYNAFAEPDAWQIFSDVEETLRQARARGLHVGVISNWDDRLRGLLEKLGLAAYFDSMTISCEVGVEKPASAIFQAALRTAGVTADNAAHVGDSYEDDVRGAEAVGMRAVLVDRGPEDKNGIRDLREIWTNLDWR
ncbi:MAG TPA: HAD-IA family hydrolase [Verrucomicrobiae bacterium]|nr:HAD-IA family hydrolase [Verrucomicrobiae bacterium]